MTKEKQKDKDAEAVTKTKISYFLDKKTEDQIAAIYIKRMQAGEKPKKSYIVEEAIALLHKKEFGK